MRAISPTSKLLVFGFALNLHFWHWPTDSYWEVKLDENEDEIVSAFPSFCDNINPLMMRID